MADGDEHALQREVFTGAGLRALDAHSGNAAVVPEDLVEHIEHLQLDLAFLHLFHQVVDHDRLGAELVAAMDQRDLLRDVRQVQRFFDRGIAAADDGDVLPLVEETVAGGTARHAAAHEGLLGRQPEVHRAGAGGNDQSVTRVLTAVADQAERPLGELRGVDVVEHDLGVEALGVREETRHQIGALDAVVVSGPVVDLGGRHQLAPLRKTGDQHRLEVGAGGVDGRGVARRAGSEDQDAGVFCGGHLCFP